MFNIINGGLCPLDGVLSNSAVQPCRRIVSLALCGVVNPIAWSIWFWVIIINDKAPKRHKSSHQCNLEARARHVLCYSICGWGEAADKIPMHAPIVHLTMCAPQETFSPTQPLTTWENERHYAGFYACCGHCPQNHWMVSLSFKGRLQTPTLRTMGTKTVNFRAHTIMERPALFWR